MAPSLLHLLAGSDSPQALESARALLDAGTSPDLRADDGLTPLHVAAAWDNVAMLQLLLLSKADPLAVDDHNRSVLDLAGDRCRRLLLDLQRADSSRKRSIFARFFRWFYSHENRTSTGRNGANVGRSLPGRLIRSCIGLGDCDSRRALVGGNAGTTSHSSIAFHTASDGMPSRQVSTDEESSPSTPQWSSDASSNDEMKDADRLFAYTTQLSDAQLRAMLVKHGMQVGPLRPGPTRVVYARRLARLLARGEEPVVARTKFSAALERVLDQGVAGSWMTQAAADDTALRSSFATCGGDWREGGTTMNFCYLLLDPRCLPRAIDTCSLRQFVTAIFYVGKGKRARPFDHLVDALRHLSPSDVPLPNRKLARITSLWREGVGVVSLHVFQNTPAVEALTREAAIIDAIGMENLTNMKKGEYHGECRRWSNARKTAFGAFLLHKALQVLHVEGARQILPHHIAS